ncbi:MAG: GspE/PulE family protein [Armatimonadia bacterium]
MDAQPDELLNGSAYTLRLGADDLALSPRARRRAKARAAETLTAEPPGLASDQATYAAVARPSLISRRDLQVVFNDGRPDWLVRGLLEPEARWAERIIATRAERARLSKSPIFQRALPPAELKSALSELAAAESGDGVILADALLLQAVWQRATDLHLSIRQDTLDVAYRVDGQLQQMASLCGPAARRVPARLKVMANAPAYGTREPITGHIRIRVDNRDIDSRLTSAPTTDGEKVTLRLFDPATRVQKLSELGFEPSALQAYQALLAQPQGCVLLTGPAGAGKSTTMYASLEEIKRLAPWRNIATIEEPVEFNLEGIDQTDINRDTGFDFAAALRVILRQDPQVIMVGEIRDPETAAIAIQAGLTGHLIFSTVHAPDTVGVFARLLELGVEPYLLASAVTTVISQRLVRKVCTACATPYDASPQDLEAAGLSVEDLGGATLLRTRSCEACSDGYSGRTGVFEMLTVTPELRRAVLERRPVHELQELARSQGHQDLWQAGLQKLQRGETTLDELVRVLGRRGA